MQKIGSLQTEIYMQNKILLKYKVHIRQYILLYWVIWRLFVVFISVVILCHHHQQQIGSKSANNENNEEVL